ncbi:DUF2279 domain-containing protein [Segetibacter sp. 3557_3]|uniref:DUF2279 domain-containing protein n=1 Tax=Segetibacter sp. 3557_3 TaxID=2547429 RepID=UPI0010590A3A|nr:DUF2279 domain-containing protein [Segetibacter sp. 3557_3]TDH27366.1 DUF2279 domain-containing protein [Segetibacter sp. 3557_3]
MKNHYLLLLALWVQLAGFSQQVQDTIPLQDSVDIILQEDTIAPVLGQAALASLKPLHYEYNRNRVKLVAAGNIAGYSLSMVGLYAAWYSQYPQTSFHTFNDNREWLQVDKVGHAYSAYAWSYASMETWRWTGVSRNKRIWLGGLSGAAYQTAIEVLDGFSAGWGWSWGDFAANIAGSGLLIAQELKWDEQRLQPKFSFHHKSYRSKDLNAQSNIMYGERIYERFLKDYNGQTYWLSANLRSFFPGSNLPAWLNIAGGYGAEGLFGAKDNVASDDHGNLIFNRRDVRRYRQWFLAPDVDLRKIRTNSKALRLALGALNVLKFPTPSLEFSNNRVSWNWIHF